MQLDETMTNTTSNRSALPFRIW